jgi:hypothetical protein
MYSGTNDAAAARELDELLARAPLDTNKHQLRFVQPASTVADVDVYARAIARVNDDERRSTACGFHVAYFRVEGHFAAPHQYYLAQQRSS